MAKTKVAAVTLMGQKHMHRGVPCEDNSLAVDSNGVSVVVVSDGAGGKEYTHARYGSKIACETIADILTHHFDAVYNENREAAVKNLLIAAIHTNMADAMTSMNLDKLERLSCTLLFCAVKDRRVICGHIGDGLIVRISGSGISPMSMPQNGENASSTYFVTAAHAADYLRLIKTTTDDLHGIALMTDGVQDMVYDENSGLVRPVVARMTDTLKGSRESCEREIRSILEKYVVGASNMSDDASFGIMYFDQTQAPDTTKLPTSSIAFPKNPKDTFKELQMEWLPRVKKAKSVIMNAGAIKIPSAEKEEKNIPQVPKETHEGTVVEDKIEKIEEKQKIGDGFVLGVIIGIMFSALLVGVLYLILF